MANPTIICAFIVLFCGSCAQLVLADAPNPIEFMARSGMAMQKVGLMTMCLADKSDNADIRNKVYKAYDTAVTGIMQNAEGHITQEKLANLMHFIVSDVSDNLGPIDSKCADVSSNYCPASKQSALGTLGKALQTLGATIVCLVADPKPEILGQFPVIMGEAIEKVASSNGASTTSVGILLPQIITVGTKLQQLSPSCASVLSSC